MSSSIPGSYQGLKPYFGDIHNHCDLSYGQGPLEAAFQNARLQLDFASVTVHADWPDLPQDEPGLNYLVAYHREGFERASANWPGYLQAVERQNEEGKFVVFPSFEWHSNQFGDYCVYYRNGEGASILRAPDLDSLRVEALSCGPAMIIPHHIGYKTGSRGINWEAFSGQLSPVVEIFSFHGLSESCDGPYPYLHSMGPCHEQSTAQHGWRQGHRFGVVGSTDHHNAFPGSYGYGRAGVWASELSRNAIWDAVMKRRTYALTGDRIELAFALNDCTMGDTCPSSEDRRIEVSVCGSSSIDYIDILHNNQLIHRDSPIPLEPTPGLCKVLFEVGWGEGFESMAWDVRLKVSGGELSDVEPHFHGFGPTAKPGEAEYATTSWKLENADEVWFHTHTQPNLASQISMTQGLNLEIVGSGDTLLSAEVNCHHFEVRLADLLAGSRTFYLGGFVSPAVCFHRAVPRNEYAAALSFDHQTSALGRDWYYVRVRQKNNQYAWSSPIWVDGAG